MTDFIHADSKHQLAQAAREGRQSLLVGGQPGSGLLESAKYFARQMKASLSEVKPVDRSTEKIDMENGKILVSLIRNLYTSTRTKATSPRVVVVHAADTMTAAAQGAFLKLLEEPGENVHFVLLSQHPGKLLPTILSRVASIRLQKITTEQSNHLLDELGLTDSKMRQQILFMADGLPHRLTKLASDEAYFKSQVDIMAAAKQLIQADTYDKLVTIGKYKDNREMAIELVDKAMLIAKKTLNTQPKYQLICQLSSLLKAKEELQANGSVRLVLMRSIL